MDYNNDNLNEHLRQVYEGNRWENLDFILSDDILRKVADAMKNYKVHALNPIRKNKKLLVLDIDSTLIYRDGTRRSYLDEMLVSIYRNYDIALWSAACSEQILKRLQALELLNTNEYKFAFFLDKSAMISVATNVEELFVKPLCIIWRKFPQYSAKNTITFDDNWRNYILNKMSGISTPRNANFEDKNHDTLLLNVADYLKQISTNANFETLNHMNWMKSLERFRNQIPFQARIIGGSITMDILSMGSEVNFALFASLGQLPPNLPRNKNGERLEKFKMETQLPIISVAVDTSNILGTLEDPRTYVKQLEHKIASVNIKLLNPLRKQKKLLVLDFDYTLCDPKVDDFSCFEAKRPYLTEFLSKVYHHYDIAIWCTKSSEWTMDALAQLNILTHKNYRIAFCLASDAMIFVKFVKSGPVQVKPLHIIWHKFPRYNINNTIAIDDIEGNFTMNPNSRLEIEPYSITNRYVDLELRKLARYLETIALVNDFSRLNHEKWRCLEKLTKINDVASINKLENTYKVNIMWPGNRVSLLNVHEDITVNNIKVLFAEVIGFAIHNVHWVIHRLDPRVIKVQPYIDKQIIISHNSRLTTDGESTNWRYSRKYTGKKQWSNTRRLKYNSNFRYSHRNDQDCDRRRDHIDHGNNHRYLQCRDSWRCTNASGTGRSHSGHGRQNDDYNSYCPQVNRRVSGSQSQQSFNTTHHDNQQPNSNQECTSTRSSLDVEVIDSVCYVKKKAPREVIID